MSPWNSRHCYCCKVGKLRSQPPILRRRPFPGFGDRAEIRRAEKMSRDFSYPETKETRTAEISNKRFPFSAILSGFLPRYFYRPKISKIHTAGVSLSLGSPGPSVAITQSFKEIPTILGVTSLLSLSPLSLSLPCKIFPYPREARGQKTQKVRRGALNGQLHHSSNINNGESNTNSVVTLAAK